MTQVLEWIGAVIGALAAIALAVGLREFRRRANQAATNAAIATLRELASAAVKAVEQTQVLAAKDPEKRGTWNEAAAIQAKAAALLTLRVTGRASLMALEDAGSSSADLDALTTALIEEAVLDLRTMKPSAK